SMAVGAGTSIDRTFDIDPANNASLSAMLRIDYFDAELNGQDPNLLKQFRKSPGATDWTPGFVTNSGANFVEGGPYSSMALWTLSADGTSAVGELLPAISVKYYPNPVENGSQIFVEGLTQGKYDFVLFDMRGRKVWEKNSRISAGSDMETFRLPNLAEGVYSLHIISESRVPTTGLLEIR
ncbi:MAG: T9SS type A sorting domain-containing protein, partial [Bacteroidetes bacterium]|nr:T9SS type A sorting domain-containing protein [Bacteroidota bacterium]